MKTLLVLVFALISVVGFSQVAVITKPVTLGDTTISKCFVKVSYKYEQDKFAYVRLTTYMSKGGLRNGNGAINVAEIPSSLNVDLSADQSKTLSQLDGLIKVAVRQELKNINPTWVNADINWIE